MKQVHLVTLADTALLLVKEWTPTLSPSTTKPLPVKKRTIVLDTEAPDSDSKVSILLRCALRP